MKELIVIPTPIGNLSDLSPSISEALASVDTLLCESFSSPKTLYQHLNLPLPRLVRYWQKTEENILKGLGKIPGQKIGLVTDAGMPAISDPGYCLVSAWHDKGWPLSVISGPSALTMAIAGSGIPAESFQFFGFLPTGKDKRKIRLEVMKSSGITGVVYESPKRLVSLCELIEDVFGSDHMICIAKELTKRYEAYYRGSVSAVLNDLRDMNIKGEYVVVISRVSVKPSWEKEAQVLRKYLSLGDVATVLAEIHNASRSKIYHFLLEN